MKFNVRAAAAGALMLALGASGQAWSAGGNEYDSAQLVPYATYTAAGATTAVGLLSLDAGTVYWAFFDVDGVRRTNGTFAVSADQLRPFIWSTEAAGAGASLAGVPGFLLFAIDVDGNGLIQSADGSDNLGANAFFVDTANSDVAYVPTLDIDDGDLSTNNPANWANEPIADLDGSADTAADGGDVVKIQYLIDGAAGGDDTDIFIWATAAIGATQSATLNDGDGSTKAVTLSTPDTNLNIVDPEADSEVTSGFFGDGYVTWTVPGGPGADAFVFSIVSSTTFGAVQTLIGNFID